MEDIEDKVVDVDEVRDVDVKINPDYYVHLALSSAIKALSGDDLEKAFWKFRILVETAENVFRGSGRLVPEYDDEVEKFRGGLKGEDGDSMKVANFKVKLLMDSVAKSRFVSDSLII